MSFPTGSFRGGVRPSTSLLYGVWSGEVWEVDTNGSVTLFSTLAGTDLVHIGRNNATIPQNAVVTDNGAFVIDTTAAAVATYPDSDVGSPTCCCGYLGYFFFGYGNGTMQCSGYNTTDINTINQAQTVSNPDGLLNIKGYKGQIYAFGEQTVEVWGEPINATGFPLTRVGFNITPGIACEHGVAGWEPEFGMAPIYVGSDNTVRMIQGYQAVVVSNSDVETDLQNLSFLQKSQIDTLCYISGGNHFWQMNLAARSWVLHVEEGTWHERRSKDSTRSKLQRSIYFSNNWLVGDTDTAQVYKVVDDEPSEAGNTLTAIMESGPLKDFPRRQRVNRLDLDFTVGVGISTGSQPTQTDPQTQIEISYDGGRNFAHSWDRKLGKDGKPLHRVFINNLGMTEDEGPRVRWTVSDQVHLGFQGGDIDTEVKTK